MFYVMSDIHGEYDKYIKMLELINFSNADELYVLGDIVDRGKEPVKVLLDMMSRANIFPVMGNHDLLALDIMKKLCVDIEEENFATQVDISVMNEVLDWFNDGGMPTLEKFRELDKTQRGEVIEYVESFPLCEIAEVNENIFILVHAGLGNFSKNKKFKDYTPEEVLLYRTNPDIRLFDDDSVYVVSGHTPTQTITGKSEIYIKNNNICIDCGACFGGRLGCLCLDTMEEFYV